MTFLLSVCSSNDDFQALAARDVGSPGPEGDLGREASEIEGLSCG